MTGGGGGGAVRRIFLGLKFSTPVFFWVEDLTVHFFGCKKSARIFWVRISARLIPSSYGIQAKVPARSKSMIQLISSLVFFWLHNVRSMYFFGFKMLGSVGPPRHVYTRVPPPPLGSRFPPRSEMFSFASRDPAPISLLGLKATLTPSGKFTGSL